MTRRFFLLLFLLVQQSECFGNRFPGIAGIDCEVPENIKCPSNKITLGRKSDCKCKYNCQAVSVHCNNHGKIEKNVCPVKSIPSDFRSSSGFMVTIGSYSDTHESFKINCYGGKTVTHGKATCSTFGFNITTLPTCACTKPENSLIRCDEDSVRAGDEMHFICKNNCRPISPKCLKDGKLENLNDYCTGFFQNEKFNLASYGQKVQMSYTNTNQDAQSYKKIQLYCDEVNTLTTGSAWCYIYSGELSNIALPVCTADNVSMAENECRNPPEELNCPVEIAKNGMEVVCRCKENCLSQTIRCLDGNWSDFNRSMCTAYYDSVEFQLPNGEKVNVSYKQGSSPPEVKCAAGTETRTPGIISCTDGEIKLLRDSSCGNACITTELPEDYVKCEQNEKENVSSVNCTCIETCLPVTITCSANGTWNDVSELCKGTINRRSDNVISNFNNGTYTFSCAQRYQPISGKNFAVCINGSLNLTAESELKCQPKPSKGKFPTVWASLGTVVFILVIILTILTIHCYRRNNEPAPVTEHIGFVMINDRRIAINPVPASPTSIVGEMEENDLYGVYDGPKNKQ